VRLECLIGVWFHLMQPDAPPLQGLAEVHHPLRPLRLQQRADFPIGPIGLNLRSHGICSNCLSQKELHQHCQVCLMVETPREIRL
jgi:hypothetical protein